MDLQNDSGNFELQSFTIPDSSKSQKLFKERISPNVSKHGNVLHYNNLACSVHCSPTSITWNKSGYFEHPSSI